MRISMLLATLLAAIALPVCAQQPPAGGGGAPMDFDKMFKDMDKNGDGVVTKEEWLAYPMAPAEHFAVVDANHDGKVTLQELKTAPAPQMPAGVGGPGGPNGPTSPNSQTGAPAAK